MKKVSILLFALLVATQCAGQIKRVTYRYVDNENFNNDNENKIGIGVEFSTQRVYYANNVFKESRLLNGDSEKYIKYKIINGIWYSCDNNGGWRLFFDPHSFKGGSLYVFKMRYDVKFVSRKAVRGDELYVLSILPRKIKQNHQSLYYFNPNKGISMISTSGGLLLRRDCFDSPLSANEIDLLQK
jgi:hypothetical protein